MEALLRILFFAKKNEKGLGRHSHNFLRVTINGDRRVLSNYRYIDKERWSVQAGRVKGNLADSREINQHLDVSTKGIFIPENFSKKGKILQ